MSRANNNVTLSMVKYNGVAKFFVGIDPMVITFEQMGGRSKADARAKFAAEYNVKAQSVDVDLKREVTTVEFAESADMILAALKAAGIEPITPAE